MNVKNPAIISFSNRYFPYFFILLVVIASCTLRKKNTSKQNPEKNLPEKTQPEGNNLPADKPANDPANEPEDRNLSGKGIIDGNGGLGINYFSNPWFTGDSPVRYCLKRSEEFSPTFEKIDAVLKVVIDEWSSTIGDLILEEDQKALADAGIIISNSFIKDDACDSKTDLIFYFGDPENELNEILQNQPKNLIGYAFLKEYDTNRLRGRGGIYIAPDTGEKRYTSQDLVRDKNYWSHNNHLRDVLLHELGHVMGFPHDEITFMAEYFPGISLKIDAPSKVSTSQLIKRKELMGINFHLCAFPWYSNGEHALIDEFMQATEVCINDETSDSNLLFKNGSEEYEKKPFRRGTWTASSSGYTTTIFTGDENLTIATIMRDKHIETSLDYNNETIPMTIDMTSMGFDIHFYDPSSNHWHEVVFYSQALGLFNPIE